MTPLPLVEIENLVRRLGAAMESGDNGKAVFSIAAEYAAHCRAANGRLEVFEDLAGKGRGMECQALMTATRSPDLLDLCSVLGELQTNEWRVFCEWNGLPVPDQIRESARRLIEPLYAKAGISRRADSLVSGPPYQGGDFVLPPATIRPAGTRADTTPRSVGIERAANAANAGIPVWALATVGISAIGLMASALLMLPGGSKADGIAKEMEAALRDRSDWKAAKVLLPPLGSEELATSRENPKFRAMEETIKLAERYQWIVENDLGTVPEGSGVRDSMAYLESVIDAEKDLVEMYGTTEVEMTPFPFLVSLREEAIRRVTLYSTIRGQLEEDWGKLLTGEILGLNSDRLDNDELFGFSREMDDLKSTKKIVEQYVNLKKRQFENEESVASAKKEVGGLVKEMDSLLSQSESQPWQKSLALVYAEIEKFEPKVIEQAPPVVVVPEKAPVEMKPEVAEKVEAKAIPVTYFWKMREDNLYPFGGVAELAGAFPKYPYLTPKTSYGRDELGAVLTSGFIVPPNIYHESTPKTPVFKVGTGKSLEPAPTMPAPYKEGFFLALGSAKGVAPDVQILAQKASHSVEASLSEPYFVSLPLVLALKKEGGNILLSDELRGFLQQLRFPSLDPVFHLLWTQEGAVVADWEEKDPTQLQGELAGGLELQLVAAKAEVERYAARKRGDEEFVRVFGDLGKVLFCNATDGKQWLYKLEIKETRRSSYSTTYELTPVQDKEADGRLCKTMEEFRAKSTSGRPLLIDYVNYHLYDVFRGQALSAGSEMSSMEEKSIRDTFQGLLNPDNWGPVGIENALQGWLKLTKESKEKRWAEIPAFAPTTNLALVKDRVRRYPTNRFRSDFFKQWETVFSEANVGIAREKLLGGDFQSERLEKLEKNLELLEKQHDEAGSKPLAELGKFYVIAESGPDFFRVIEIR